MMKIARVFPRRTSQSPTDDLAFFGPPHGLFPPDVDAVHVSVTFSWDMSYAVRLSEEWAGIAPVSMGGPATGRPSGEFTAGLYVKPGVVFTSRGCPNRCWFCSVPGREGGVRELRIRDGWIVQDDNLLGCSERHVRNVFAMLQKQPHKAQFAGGLEAARLETWSVNLLAGLRPAQMFFAYDTPHDLEPLRVASRMLIEAGFNRQSMRCFVLIGYPQDSIELADVRLRQTVALGFYPQAMLWRDESGGTAPDWRRFARLWARPAIIQQRLKQGDT